MCAVMTKLVCNASIHIIIIVIYIALSEWVIKEFMFLIASYILYKESFLRYYIFNFYPIY